MIGRFDVGLRIDGGEGGLVEDCTFAVQGGLGLIANQHDELTVRRSAFMGGGATLTDCDRFVLSQTHFRDRLPDEMRKALKGDEQMTSDAFRARWSDRLKGCGIDLEPVFDRGYKVREVVASLLASF